MSIIIQAVTAAYPTLVEPTVNRDFPNSPAKFGMTLLMDPNHPGFAQFMAEAQKMAQDKWKEHAPNVLNLIQSQRNLRCFGRGEEALTKTGALRAGYAGKIYLSCSSDKDHPPQIVKREGGIVKVAHDLERQELAKRIYGGCLVNVAISPWLQDNAAGKAIRCNLHAVEFAGDGEPLGDGSSVDVASLFGSITPPATTMSAAGGMTFPGMPSFLS